MRSAVLMPFLASLLGCSNLNWSCSYETTENEKISFQEAIHPKIRSTPEKHCSPEVTRRLPTLTDGLLASSGRLEVPRRGASIQSTGGSL